MKYSDVKELGFSDLVKKKKELNAELMLLKMKNSIGQLSNPIEIRNVRRNLAKITTAISSTKKK